MNENKCGILVVSFGTTHLDTLEETIAQVERDIAAAFPACPVYRAFTSNIVRERLKTRENMDVESVEQALRHMERDGLCCAAVVPTLLIPGEEYELVRQTVLEYDGNLTCSIGLPLLWDERDLAELEEILEDEYPVGEGTARLMMGHGTAHTSNIMYLKTAARERRKSADALRCKKSAPLSPGGARAVCTVEGTPTFEDALKELLARPERRVLLVPLLLVAGDHSKNDMAGGEGSLRAMLEEHGFEVECVLRGLGQSAAIRAMYVRRAHEAMERL